jgi:hypothetical protein
MNFVFEIIVTKHEVELEVRAKYKFVVNRYALKRHPSFDVDHRIPKLKKDRGSMFHRNTGIYVKVHVALELMRKTPTSPLP